jgi:hypothetical protein
VRSLFALESTERHWTAGSCGTFRVCNASTFEFPEQPTSQSFNRTQYTSPHARECQNCTLSLLSSHNWALAGPLTSVAMYRTPAVLRSALPTVSRASTRAPAAWMQTRQAHAVSNPTLANIEKRWEAMPPQEQADLWMALRDRMKVDWKELTVQEKKAGTLRFQLP